MKKSIYLVLIILLFIVGCNKIDNSKTISLIGSVEETIEAGTDYNDKGVSIPEGYTYSVNGYVYSNIVDRYEIIYLIYSSNGELEKELHRFVNVVDTTAPTYEITDISTLTIKHQYTINDFISKVEDNSTPEYYIKIDTSSLMYFDKKGIAKIEISFTDYYGNVSIYKREFVIDYSVEDFINQMNKEGKIQITTNKNVGKYIRIQIDSKKSLAYYFNTNQLILTQKVNTKLGNYASIQFSIANKEYNRIGLDYHVSNSSIYSTGFITFDGTQEYESFGFNSFDSSINGLQLNEKDMINELNENVLDVYKEFILYIYYDWSNIEEVISK